MLKFTGAVMILSVAVYAGYRPIMMMKQRKLLLQRWISILERIRAELHTNLPDMPTLLGLLCDAYSDKMLYDIHETIAQEGAAAFSEAWAGAVNKYCSQLSQEERQSVCNLGAVLGCYILEEELYAVSNVIVLLRSGAEECSMKLREHSKLYLGCTTAMGFILVVMLF